MTKFLAFSLVSVSLFLAVTIQADEGGGDSFEKRKAKILAETDERLKHLQELKSCVSSAADMEGLKKCRETMRQNRHHEKLERLEERKARREQKAEKLKEQEPK